MKAKLSFVLLALTLLTAVLSLTKCGSSSGTPVFTGMAASVKF